MRREWGCTYFKLDATYWATLPGGRRHDTRATRIEAYRRAGLRLPIISPRGDTKRVVMDTIRACAP